MTDAWQSALDQLHAYGLQVDTLETDGKLRRVKAEGDKGSKKSGWYVAHEFTLKSGRMVITGRFGNWKAGSEPQAFQFDAKLTEEEKQKFKEQQAAQRKAAEKEKQARNKSARERAAKIWPSLPEDGDSKYLARKKIHGFGCRYSRGSIVVPLSRAGELLGLQFIDADGNKKFLTGTEKQGAYFEIDGKGAPILCEGYATGCSLRMATGRRVYVCFDAGNLESVAQSRKGDFTIAADNDHKKSNNKGLEIAHRIKSAHPKAAIVWPAFSADDTGTDFNDLHVTQGLDAVKAYFSERARGPQAYPANFSPQPVENTPDQPPAPPKPAAVGDPPPDFDWQSKIKRQKTKDGPGAILPLSSNIDLILRNDTTWQGALAYCDFSYRIIKRSAVLPDMQAGEWEDSDTARLAIWLSNTYGFEPTRAKITDGLIVAAQRARFHPVREYLGGLTWDGTERLADWLIDIYDATADNTDYLRVVGEKFLIGAVGRVMKPGCKMDNVMILEGRQGLRKSTSIGVLFGDWFSDAPIPIGDKDAYQNIQGVWCSELAELDSFNKAESTSAKLFFSQVRDRYRPSYGQHAQDFPRQTIFVGTTNQGEYLKDYTGNRRYWPVKCNTVKLDLLRDNRDQYMAEALHKYSNGATWWPDDDSRAVFEEEQDQRMQVDPWQYFIEDFLLESNAGHWTSNDIISGAIKGKEPGQITRADQNRISPIMRKLGYVNIKKRVQVGAKKVPRHVYIKAETGANG